MLEDLFTHHIVAGGFFDLTSFQRYCQKRTNNSKNTIFGSVSNNNVMNSSGLRNRHERHFNSSTLTQL